MSPRKAAETSVRRTTGKGSQLLTAEERAAMRETLNERRRARSGEADGESDVLAKIAEMPEPDRVMAERLHAIIKASAPTLTPRTWYGMPAYAKDGYVVCFFQSGQSSSRDTRRSASNRPQTSTRVIFGQPPLP
jgi:hypothetical protein